MVAGKLGSVLAMLVGGLLTNFASAGSDSESDSETARESLRDQAVLGLVTNLPYFSGIAR